MSLHESATIAVDWVDGVPSGGDPEETYHIEQKPHPTIRQSKVTTQFQKAFEDFQRRGPRVIDDMETADYSLIEVLGKGGMGCVWLARQQSLGRAVAIKCLRRSADAKAVHRFINEAQITGGLSHPNIMPVYELGTDTNGKLFYSMKACMGDSWKEAMETMRLDENIETLVKVSNAVAYAHSRGVIHRDLKPQNIMLGDFGDVLVLDWGLAAMVMDDRSQNKRELVGTPMYMAPEMASGKLEMIGETTDIYLLGGLLYEILTGHPPHYGHATVRTCLQRAADNVIAEPQNGIPPGTSEYLAIAKKAMATNPEDRFFDVAAFISAVRNAGRHEESRRLAERATQYLQRAQNYSDGYEDYSRAMFCYEEALAVWGGNNEALVGLETARLVYGEAAIEKGDLDLAAIMLQEGEPDHKQALNMLRVAYAQRTGAPEYGYDAGTRPDRAQECLRFEP